MVITKLRKRIRSPRRRGAAAVEFALWLPFVALLFSCLVDFSQYMSQKHGVTRAAREGARS